MLKKLLTLLVGLGVVAAIAGWVLSAPDPLPQAAIGDGSGDAAAGAQVFLVAGCASCHSAKDTKGDARLVLSGGKRFGTEFGTFVAPNISTDAQSGIGGWDWPDFANAMMRGVSPDGRHYYPAFPYASYARMQRQDVADLWAYMQTLPASTVPSEPHELSFPFSIRRSVGVWKFLNMPADGSAVLALDSADEQILRGQYLVEGPGHCGECHTPRDALGGLDLTRWLNGAPNPEGTGRIPDITPGGKTVSSWAAVDIAEYLASGFTPDFDTAGGTMVEVIENTSQLPPEDRAAIAAYLKAVPSSTP